VNHLKNATKVVKESCQTLVIKKLFSFFLCSICNSASLHASSFNVTIY